MKNKSIRKQLAALFLSGAVLLSACGQTSPDDVEAGGSQSLWEQTTEADTKAPETANASGVDVSVYMDTSVSVEERVAALLSQMTLEEKIGQMVQAEQAGLSPDDVTTYGIGSVLSGGGSAPSTGNTAADWQARINELKEAALKTRLGIPLFPLRSVLRLSFPR